MPRTVFAPTKETLLAFVAGDTVNGNRYAHTGSEILLVRNAGGSTRTVTIKSAPDPANRGGDLGAYSLGAGQFAALPPLPAAGWRQPDGHVWVDVSHTDIQLAAVRLPVGAVYSPDIGGALLLETGDYRLLESGDHLLLEAS